MAKKTTVLLQDDLDGGPAARTLHFALGGSEFEIDLSEKNASDFRRQLDPFLEHAHRPRGLASASATRTPASRKRSNGIRAWARDHGLAVGDRGRIPASVIERYEAAKVR
jgi:hypothetical protein